jgi:hypothetical protein
VNKKMLIRVGIPAVAVAAVLAVGLGFLLFGSHKQLRYRTQAALLQAVPVTAADELRARGVRLTAPLACTSMPEATKVKLRVACTGMAQGRKVVQVVATGETKTQDHYFTILVGGRPVVQNADCMGADCRRED